MVGWKLGGKILLVKWDVVCTEKLNGGLGLRRIATLNRALLGKWTWKFACEKDNLWKQVILRNMGKRNTVGGLRRLVGRLELGPFLEDDSVKWRQGRNGLFRVKEAYRMLDKPNATVFPARRIWVDRVLTKVCFFAWEATWGREEKETDLKIHSVVYFWMVWKERNRREGEEKEKKEKEKEKEKEKKEGVSGRRRVRRPRRGLIGTFMKRRRTALSLGMPFKTMDT
ncbi:hypothetical protein CK203_093706 [Vitis vinifera]|uniref:Uncharacterized protein n=1 Tax=Vitis vinifera TaxID=29760 RepID=A0A438D1Z0_VITVI|nr:hypothetical protein CK203_093706 [Vitis vinifera]